MEGLKLNTNLSFQALWPQICDCMSIVYDQKGLQVA